MKCNGRLEGQPRWGTTKPEQLDYEIDGVPISWLNCKNINEAIQWHMEHCPYLTDEVNVALAEADMKKKMKYNILQELEHKKFLKQCEEELLKENPNLK